MTPEQLRQILAQVAEGALSPDEALQKVKHLPFEDIGFARVDHHRHLRVGFPEVIFGQGKTGPQIVAIAERLLAAGQNVLVTRIQPEAAAELLARIPGVEHDPVARTASRILSPASPETRGTVLVIAAGTSDLPVAAEARRTLEAFGQPAETLYDVGVSGLHRLLASKERLTTASVLIVVAGMEGALPSVVAGLVDCPVIAVPTSIGYGASFGGIAALLGMLNSCAAGVVVVNIDNGFGAAVAAAQINRRT
ncbi:MAG: nickel pincer cofactor biosynthesis protein LarB [Deltaproteobacteria bacterium]|nr:nickel pincer cofactor biosynthesis protein LarB [Deltaproteobacteria bacterium]